MMTSYQIVLNWDGSNLGIYNEIVIEEDYTIGRINYWQLNLYNTLVSCCYNKVTRSNRAFGCILDEVKPIFSLIKRGSHHLKIGKNWYNIFRMPTDNSLPINELPKGHFLLTDEIFRTNVRRIFAFKSMLCLSSNYVANVFVSKIKDLYVPISINEKSTTIETRANSFGTLSKVILDSWFQNVTVEATVREMFNIKTKDDIPVALADIRNELDSIIHRLDPTYVWYICFIIGNIQAKLLAS